MIIADLKSKRGIENIQLAIQYYLNSDAEILKTGRYNIYGDKLIAIVDAYQTKKEEDVLWESHQRYIDIQYIISGREKMGYNDVNKLRLKRAYREEDDCIFYDGKGELVNVDEGMFTIFTARDAHKPGVKYDDHSFVKKLILKVEANFFDFSPDLIIDFARSYQMN